MNKYLRYILTIIGLIFLFIVIFILYITLTDFQPEPVVQIIPKKSPTQDMYSDKDTFDIISWNIGAGSLGSEMDFFYDGGTKMRPDMELSDIYFENIVKILLSVDPDFWILQEIDMNSKRSYYMNQVAALEDIMSTDKGYYSVFETNWMVDYIPLPLYSPMGAVQAGSMTLSKTRPQEVIRYSYPLISPWPDKLFLLDRFFMLNRHLLEGTDKQLVVINTHNSAYVTDLNERQKELNIIRDVMMKEYENGNYVIAGGDWNANPPGFDKTIESYSTTDKYEHYVDQDEDLFPEDWNWTYDERIPTARWLDSPYQRGKNSTTSLDYFVSSPNIKVEKIEVIDLKFKNSDHNPIRIKIKLIK